MAGPRVAYTWVGVCPENKEQGVRYEDDGQRLPFYSSDHVGASAINDQCTVFSLDGPEPCSTRILFRSRVP